jgi:predicted ferric reductase
MLARACFIAANLRTNRLGSSGGEWGPQKRTQRTVALLTSPSAVMVVSAFGTNKLLSLMALGDEHRTRSTHRYVYREEVMSTAVGEWPRFLAKLESRQEIAERTMAFRFAKPASLKFKPGQFIDITLQNPSQTDSEGDTRGFSIASAPYEDFIMVATRLRDTAFKRVLRSIPLGTEGKIEGSFGNLRLHNDKSRSAVVLTGGIGITPFRSILRHAAKEKLPHRIFLFIRTGAQKMLPFLTNCRSLKRTTLTISWSPA